MKGWVKDHRLRLRRSDTLKSLRVFLPLPHCRTSVIVVIMDLYMAKQLLWSTIEPFQSEDCK